MEKLTGLSAWTNLAFLDAYVEYKGEDYEVQLIMDGKLSIYEIILDGEPVEDDDTWNAIRDIALDTLESKDNNLLNNALNHISYEG